ncbi:hypothetical protein AS593_23740 [Caulobacter vibrioides]|nr:hypothetical protein AS593_23740 [Caulobacter vibrioides]
MSRAALLLGAAIALAGGSSTALAAPNPVMQALGPQLVVERVEVLVVDGVIGENSDVEAYEYVTKLAPEEQKAQFTRFVADRQMSKDLAAERLAEFLIGENILARLGPAGAAPDARRVKLSLKIDQADFPASKKMPLMPALPLFVPKLGAQLRIEDAATGALLAQGRVIESAGSADDMVEAKNRNALVYKKMGMNVHFQVLAGAGNALGRNVETLLRADPLPTGFVETNRYTVGAAIPVTIRDGFRHARFDIQLATPSATSQEP